MSPLTYNSSLLTGIALIGSGLALISIPAALVAVGTLVLAFTVFGALIARK
ncbi:hypothetical protein B0G62_12061 [Paraburkholderia eburnea]|uniref:Uncharacterized protein n=1 Tax=Paraburkholderia eburnea TaxID=1189126 RepID=A0A2S4LXF3_9BURK|nr:hypothetical protein [Paraburkholderia eburnea]POR47068.1 hypothetical protein B0G62_12061 [Paraburkholderia eburnea]PRZ18298.1 hypothetical protein BX588_12061 [Paraburkholderia eburnea]